MKTESFGRCILLCCCDGDPKKKFLLSSQELKMMACGWPVLSICLHPQPQQPPSQLGILGALFLAQCQALSGSGNASHEPFHDSSNTAYVLCTWQMVMQRVLMTTSLLAKSDFVGRSSSGRDACMHMDHSMIYTQHVCYAVRPRQKSLSWRGSLSTERSWRCPDAHALALTEPMCRLPLTLGLRLALICPCAVHLLPAIPGRIIIIFVAERHPEPFSIFDGAFYVAGGNEAGPDRQPGMDAGQLEGRWRPAHSRPRVPCHRLRAH